MTSAPDPASARASVGGDAFFAMAETTAAAVLVCEQDVIAYANPTADRMLGAGSSKGLVGSSFADLLHRTSLAHFLSVRPENGRLELRMAPSATASERWLDLTLSAVAWDGRLARLIVGIDVTEAKLAERSLREARRRLSDILDNVQLIAVMRDQTGEISFANPFFLELVGQDDASVLGQDWFEVFVPPEDRNVARADYLKRMQAGEVLLHGENEILTRYDRRRVSWSHSLLHDIAGKVTGVASMGVDVTERHRAEKQLLHDALHDALTGLPNRALFLNHLEAALGRTKRRPERILAVLFLDVDRFKVVNDSLGHAVGDRLLVEFGKRLSSSVRPGDQVARMGGDEFTVLLEDLEGTQDATTVTDRIHAALANSFHLGGQEVFVTASVGIALTTRPYRRPEELLRDADTAMYQAKTAGKARSQVFETSMHDRAIHVLAMENDLRRAVERQQFILHYQPIIELATRRIAGFEALVRWDHTDRGLVAPAEFIGLAEELGLISDIGDWVLRKCCKSMKEWQDRFPGDLHMAVNISGRQFAHPKLVETVASILSEARLKPHRLKIEITESIVMENAEAAISMLEQLKQLGVRISIDDFGTGYSSLSYIVRLPADTLKIDRSFVATMIGHPRSAQIAETVVALGRSLGMDTVAEGVETPEQAERLRALGCTYGQGYHFARPVDFERATELLARDRDVS